MSGGGSGVSRPTGVNRELLAVSDSACGLEVVVTLRQAVENS